MKKQKESRCGCSTEKTKAQTKGCKKEEKINELVNDLQRLQAEFENYKKRVDRDKEEYIQYAAADTIKEILPVLDNFELALQNTKNRAEFVKGVELVYSQLRQALSNKGLQLIEAKGKQFDPHVHEALLSESSDQAAGTVLEELQKGFMINDRVLRHAKVKVAR